MTAEIGIGGVLAPGVTYKLKKGLVFSMEKNVSSALQRDPGNLGVKNKSADDNQWPSFKNVFDANKLVTQSGAGLDPLVVNFQPGLKGRILRVYLRAKAVVRTCFGPLNLVSLFWRTNGETLSWHVSSISSILALFSQPVNPDYLSWDLIRTQSGGTGSWSAEGGTLSGTFNFTLPGVTIAHGAITGGFLIGLPTSFDDSGTPFFNPGSTFPHDDPNEVLPLFVDANYEVCISPDSP